MSAEDENPIPEDAQHFRAEPENSEASGQPTPETEVRRIADQLDVEMAEVGIYASAIGPDERRVFGEMIDRWNEEYAGLDSAGRIEAAARHLGELRRFRERVIAANPETPYPSEFVRGQKPEAQHALRTAEESLTAEMAGFERQLRQLDSHRGLDALQRFRDGIEVDSMLAGEDPARRAEMMERKLQEFREFRRAQMAPPPDQQLPNDFI